MFQIDKISPHVNIVLVRFVILLNQLKQDNFPIKIPKTRTILKRRHLVNDNKMKNKCNLYMKFSTGNKIKKTTSTTILALAQTTKSKRKLYKSHKKTSTKMLRTTYVRQTPRVHRTCYQHVSGTNGGRQKQVSPNMRTEGHNNNCSGTNRGVQK